MVQTLRRYRWCLALVALLSAFAWASWLSCRWLARTEGNSEAVCARLQVGMSENEAVEILRTFDQCGDASSKGKTTDGRRFRLTYSAHLPWTDLPPPSEIENCVLKADDDYGREVKVCLGRGGTITSTQLTPGFWRHRGEKAYRELRDKPYGALLYKYRKIALGSVAGLFLLSICMLRMRAILGC
jgi:hypothetical protein